MTFPTLAQATSSAYAAVTLSHVYEVDQRDQVVPLDDVPQCNPGAPLPAIAATEDGLRVAYIALATDHIESIAIVTFHSPYAHYFGAPNDEAFSGHPLADRGLEPYGAYRIADSSWIRRLERMNRVHEYHHPETFAALAHYVLSFHDSTFECVAKGYEVKEHAAEQSLTLSVEVNPIGEVWVNPRFRDN